jgi:hypothetical protein
VAPNRGSWQNALDRRFADGLEWAHWAVSQWDGFPVDQQPRPLVLVGPRVLVERGFVTGEAKMAFLTGQIECAVPVPDAALRTLQRSASTVSSGRPAPPPLLIESVTPSEREFRTDRGHRRLSAWRLQARDALGPIWILDPAVESREWEPPEPPAAAPPALQTPPNDPGAAAEIDPDDTTLTLHFMGALPEYEQYPRAEVIESAQAVAVVPAGQDIGPPGIRILPGHMHQITVHLTHPLGARVLVNLHGKPREVTTTHFDRRTDTDREPPEAFSI